MSGMKASTIKLVLRQKLDSWLETITDETLAREIKQNVIVSGGAIASMLLGEKANDYDLYFKTKDVTIKAAQYYINVFNSNNGSLKTTAVASCNPVLKIEPRTNIKGVTEERVIIYMKSSGVASESQAQYEYFENQVEIATDAFMDSLQINPTDLVEDLIAINKDKKNRYRPVFFSENAITLSDKIQLVTRFYGEPSEIHENYDYAHAMCYYDYNSDTLVLHPEALEAILSKTLIYKGSLYPIASIFRIRKFISRGWRITAGQMLKIIWQITEINLKDPLVLREQLIGVDQAYMHQLLRALESNDGARIDAAYIAKLIDEIFE